ncbi:MAG: DUF2490 domain-containing protein [Pyrinomonadaceae bacterium]|nr:DUF2490 domain-containing protein [Pyrinomonadaceae bacterium]
MKKLSLIFLLFFLFSGTFSQDTDDVVNWNELTLVFPVVKKKEVNKEVDNLSLNLSFVLRRGRNLARPIDKRVGVGLNYRVNRNFTLGWSYLYREARPTEGTAFFEHRLNFFIQTEKRWRNFGLRGRLFTNYQIIRSRPNLVVQRARLQPFFPVRHKGKEVFSFFVADEVFYSYQSRKLYRNDFFAGVTKNVTRKLDIDVFLIRQNITGAAIKETLGFGVNLRYRIPL